MTDKLFVVRITVPPALVAAIDTALELLDIAASQWQLRDARNVQFEIFCTTAAEAAQIETTLREQLTASAGAHPWDITCAPIRNEDWQESWKKYFHVEKVSPRIVTKPPWKPYTPQADECVITIDPGMTFGTGQHATTRACLRFLDALAAAHESMSFLDLGCGSGILSIAAARLGYQPILAMDIDANATRIACDNIAANGVTAAAVTLHTGDVVTWTPPHPFTVVSANILAPILEKNALRITHAVTHPNGYLLLAGILTEQYTEIRRCYTALGFREIDTHTEAEWTSGCFQRQ